jgi:hypothetical protein
MAKSSINASHLSLMAIAYIIAGCSAVLTGIFGSTFGGESWVLSAICFLMFFCISLLSPILFNALTKSVLQQNWGKIAVFFLFGLFFFATDVITNAGTVALFRKADLVRTDNQNDKAKNARNEVSRIEKDMATIKETVAWKGVYVGESGTRYPLTDPTAFDEQIRLQGKLVSQEAARVKCGPKCEERQRKLKELLAARANAVERTGLQNQYRTLDIELKEAKAAAAETPTQASAALEHARNVAAAFTLQIEPDKKSRFWANYGLSAWGGLATSLASIAAAILLAASTVSGWRRRREYEHAPEARNPYIEDMRPEIAGGNLSKTFVLNEGDGLEAMRIALRRLAERNSAASA